MANINKDYLVIADLKNSKVSSPTMSGYNTDKRIFNIFTKLQIAMSSNPDIKVFVTREEALNYTVKLTVIKPKTNQLRYATGELMNSGTIGNGAVYQFDLGEEFTDQVGKYTCELTVTCTVNGYEELITCDPFFYTIKPSAVTGLNDELTRVVELPILEYLIDDVERIREEIISGNLSEYQTKRDVNLQTDSKEIIGAINEVTEQLNNTTNDVNEQLNTKANKSEVDAQFQTVTKQLTPNFYDGSIVTFIDDDCRESVSKWETIANEKDIKLCFAVVKDWIGTNTYCNIDKIKSLQNSGHDILNHTKSHINNWNITNAEIRTQIEENINYMKQNNLNDYDVLVYPGTVPNESRYKNIVREKCRYGISNIYNQTNKVQDNFYMNRIDSDYKTLDELKAVIDKGIYDKQWILIMTHSWREDGDVTSRGTFSIEKIKQLIDYIKSKSIPILKFTDAEKYKGNAISIGDYATGIYVGKDGKNNLQGNIIKGTSINKLGTEYKEDITTIETITTTLDTIFNKGGVLQTFRSSLPNFTYQLYYLWDSNICYKRRWIENSASWSNFDRIDAIGLREIINTINDVMKINNNTDNSMLMDAPITSYEVDKETIVIIKTSLDTFKNSGGTMKVFRSSQANFSYATFVPWNESAMYIRHWGENKLWGNDIPKWTPWVKMGV